MLKFGFNHEHNITDMDNNSPKINISFEDLNYSVYYNKQEKCILKNISGKFKTGQISAILGPSGCGKTTLINILAGYNLFQDSGTITVNNEIRDFKHFYKISRYIMQENILQPFLTVLDIMMIAANFKLDSQITKREKIQMVKTILNKLNMSNIEHSKSKKLSGGEKKRLAIALELINNPAVIFLDEPTSGLDEQASFQCVSILKQLAEEGRTVICSIHAPSNKTFAMFDHVYIMADGQCVYQGQGEHILTFLEPLQLRCPMFHNPIDFFIDVASDVYGPQSEKLIELSHNGKLTYPKEDDTDIATLERFNLEKYPNYYTSTISQLYVLLYRTWLECYRNPIEFKIKFLIYCIMIITLATIYYKCGDDATKIFTNSTYLLSSIITLMYCAVMPPLIHFPIEIKMIRSEYFNRWYNLTALFLAKSIGVIPGYVMYTMLYVFITYPLTDQPIDAVKIMKFILILVMVNIIADASSMAVASIFNIVNSFFVGLAIMVPPLILSIYDYGFQYHLQPLIIKIMLRCSFLRYAFEALFIIVYEDRPQHLKCPESEVLCPITSPKLIPKVLGYGSLNFWLCVLALLIFYIICKCANYFLLKERLRPGRTTKIAMNVFERGKNFLLKYKP